MGGSLALGTLSFVCRTEPVWPTGAALAAGAQHPVSYEHPFGGQVCVPPGNRQLTLRMPEMRDH